MDSVKLFCFVVKVTMLVHVVIFETMPYGCSAAQVGECRMHRKTLRHRDVDWSKVFDKSVGVDSVLFHGDQTFTISYCSGSCRYHRNRIHMYGNISDTLTMAKLEHGCSTNTSCTAMKALRPCCVPDQMKRIEKTTNIEFLVKDKKLDYIRKNKTYVFFETARCMCF